jgi:hypothetical protein
MIHENIHLDPDEWQWGIHADHRLWRSPFSRVKGVLMSATRTDWRLTAARIVCVMVMFGALLGGIDRTAATNLSAAGNATPNGNRDARIIAIDVLLEPEAALVRYMRGVDAQLRREYPWGYTLDVIHNPHITLVQRYVRSSDIRAISEAVGLVVEEERATTLQLTANRYAPRVSDGVDRVVQLVVDVTPRLRILERRIVDAVQPFAVSGGTASAFASVPGSVGTVNYDAIDFVENFVPDYSGDRFAAFLAVGVAPSPFAYVLRPKPFEPFTFGIDEVAIYQLGQSGTAQERLWGSNARPCPCPWSD